MPRLALLALAVCATSCMNVARAINGQPNPDVAWVRETAAPVLACPEKGVEVINDSDAPGFGWTANGCGRSVACQGSWEKWRCVPLPLPEWMILFAKNKGTLVEGEDGFRGVKAAVAEQTGCTEEPTAVVLEKRQRGGTATFGVNLCDRQFQCVSAVDRHANVTDETKCTELAESATRAAKQIAVNRLALETGCAAAKIRVESEGMVGSERAARLDACGKSFVCTTAGGRTECRPALDQGPSEVPDGGSEIRDGGGN